MTVTQLAIRSNAHQLETLDRLASELHTTRTAVIQKLVDDAGRARVAALYAAACQKGERDVDEYGDVDAFRADAESERVAGRAGDTSW